MNKTIQHSYKKLRESIRIDSVYIINLPHREDRLKCIVDRCMSFDMKVSIVEGVVTRDKKNFQTEGQRGCYLAKIKALETFLSSPHQTSLILEDDCKFVSNFIERLYTFLKIVNRSNVPWDICFLHNHNVTEYDLLKLKKIIPFNREEFPEISMDYTVRKYKGFLLNHKQYDNHAFIVTRCGARKILKYWYKIDQYEWKSYSDMYIMLNDHIAKICPEVSLVIQDRDQFSSDNPQQNKHRM